MKKVLITGIEGFTGTYLSEILKNAGFKVIGISNFVNHPHDDLFQCDLLDKTRLQEIVMTIKPDYVIHLAAISFVGHGQAEDFYRVNVVGTMNLLSVLSNLEKIPSKVLVVSSANVYGEPDVEIIDESVSLSPINHYATSKVAMEYMVSTVFDELPIIIIRPFNYTGKGQEERFLIPKIVGYFKRKEKVIQLGNLAVSRDFSDVRDIAVIYTRLLSSDIRSAIVNVCSGRSVSIEDILVTMNDIAGYAIEVNINPEFVRENEITRLQGDNKYLQQLINFVPSIPLEDTLLWMYGDTK